MLTDLLRPVLSPVMSGVMDPRRIKRPVTVYGSYSVGLADTADGGQFAILSTVGDQVYIYTRIASKGVLQTARPYPIAGTQDALAADCANTAVTGAWPVAPIVDVDSSQANFGAHQFRNLAISDPVTLNMLSMGDSIYRGPMFGFFGGVLTEGQTDPLGGTNAFKFTASAGSGSRPFLGVSGLRIPPGQYTIAAEYSTPSGTIDFAIQPDQLGGAGAAVIKTATTTWTTQSVTFELTAETTIRPAFVMAQASPWPATDVRYIYPRLVPGSSAGAAVLSVGNVSRPFTAAALLSGNFFRHSTAASAPVYVQFPAKKAFTTFSYLCAFRFDPVGTQLGALLCGDLNDKFALFTGPGKDTLRNSFAFLSNVIVSYLLGSTPGVWNVVAVTIGAAGLKAYINSFQVYDTAVTALSTTQAALSFHDGSGFPFSGLVSSHAVWDVQLSDAEVTTATAVMQARLSLKGVSVGSMNNFLIADGDSITQGAGTGIPYIHQMNPLFTPVLQGRNFATSGATLMSVLSPRQSTVLAYVTRTVAAGKRPIVVILIGINDINATLTTNALVDAYMVNLKAYWAAYRSAGAKLIVGTVGGRDTDPNRTQRDYLNGLIRGASAFYDGLADYAADANLNEWNATYMMDGVHMSAAGNNLMASILYPVLATLVLP